MGVGDVLDGTMSSEPGFSARGLRRSPQHLEQRVVGEYG